VKVGVMTVFKIMDTEKLFIPVKSGFPTAAKAYDWAKKHLGKDSCHPWSMPKIGHRYRYFIQSY
jgi:hypothetical protein